MPDRKYSIQEIDRMRQCIRYSYPSGVPYYEHERAADIENRLRTYMLNGTDPKELEELTYRQFPQR
jgi:hypothetical protein